MSVPLLTTEGRRRIALLATAVSSPPSLTEAKFRLIKEDFTPSAGLVLADLVEADFAGYGVKDAVWDAVVVESPTVVSAQVPTLLWEPTSDATPNIIYGVMWVHPAFVGPPPWPEALIAVEHLDVPVSLMTALDGFRYDPRFTLL